MKALSIRQPWASLIAEGYKTIELRTWKTNYRGPLAIHASKQDSSNEVYLALDHYLEPRQAFLDCFIKPRGRIIAMCNLIDIISFGVSRKAYSKYEKKHLCPLEYFEFIPYGWVLVGVKPLDTPIPCKGQLGLFEVNL